MAERASSKQYLVVDEDGKGHLPVRDSPDGPLNHHLMGAAWAALHGGYRGNKYEGPGKEAAIAKLKSLYKSEGMELPSLSGDREIGPPPGGYGPQGGTSGELFSRSPDPPQSGITRSRSERDQPRFWMTLAEPPATGLIRIPIAITGKWKGAESEFSVGLDDLNEIGKNFAEKPTGEINVDYEHASEVPFGTGGPVLSAGRIVKLDKPESFNGTGKHILWGWYEPTTRARELIANKEYRYISPAIRWGAKDKVTGKVIGTILTSVALVNKPFLEELPQLHLSEAAGDQKILVSLGQLHIPGPVNQISVAYGQPGQKAEVTPSVDGQKSGGHQMAKSLKLKCLTDEHLAKHGLEPEHKGKIGVFDGEELIGVAPPPEGWEPKDGEGDGNGKDSKKLAELFATEIGLPGKSLADIAATVKRGTEAPKDQFAALSAAIQEGQLNIVEAGKLADTGRVKFSTILQAQEAERKVEAAVKAGKVLPKNRAHALRVALSDAAAFGALVEQGQPVVDLRTRGHAGGGEQPTAQQSLMAEVNAYAKENKCSIGVALSEVTKRKPDLWQQYSEEIVTAVEAAQEEE
jgi:phage I-like protein